MTRALALFLTTLALVAYAAMEGTEPGPRIEPPEPGRGPFGLGELTRLLERHGHSVEYGAPARPLSDYGLVLLIAPRGTGAEERLLREALDLGVGVVLGDELGVLNKALEDLGVAVGVGFLERGGSGGWEYVVEFRCVEGLGGTWAAKASWIEVEPGVEGVEILCTSQGRPTVARVSADGARLLLVSDSSLFTNYMIRGWANISSTAPFIARLIAQAGPLDSGPILVANLSTATQAGEKPLLLGVLEALGGLVALLSTTLFPLLLTLAAPLAALVATRASEGSLRERGKDPLYEEAEAALLDQRRERTG